MELKTEVWERVRELAILLANEDQLDRYRANYNTLKEYCESQSAEGYDHPFLWESLADFALDDDVAIALYLRALSRAASDDAREYRVSIRFGLAERYKRKSEMEVARQYAIEADDEARETDDRELRRRISRFLLSGE